MQYERLNDLAGLASERLISVRLHPKLPLAIYNYTVQAQFLNPHEWTPALADCRGLILDDHGEVVGRPFKKFFNYGSVLDQVPADLPFTVWEKLDGSLLIVASYAGERIVATRGSFCSDQAKWGDYWFRKHHPYFSPWGETWLFEAIYSKNRIVVDYGKREEAVLLAVMAPDGVELPYLFDNCARFSRARRFDGISDFATIANDPKFAGEEGFVVKWANSFMVKCKTDEYCRLHKLITQCSTRTIWELLKTGQSTAELIDRVPAAFAQWVSRQAEALCFSHENLMSDCRNLMAEAPASEPRRTFAEWAKKQPYPSLLFNLLDGRDISDAAWKIVEPKWSTPFRKEAE